MTRFVIAFVGLAISISVFVFYTRPAYDSTRALQTEIKEYDQALERANELQSLKQTLLSRYNAFDPAQIDRLHHLLPDHVDNVRLVLDIDTIAAQHGLSLQNVIIANPSSDRSETATSVVGGERKLHDSLTLKFSTNGTYDGFVRFMENLESSLRIVDLVTLAIGPGTSVPGEPIYRFDVTIRTYWLK